MVRDSPVRANMLPLADRHLHLRQHVPVRLRTVHQIAVRQKFHHRAPLASQPMIPRQRLPQRRVIEQRLRRLLRIYRQVRAHLKLHPGICPEQLIRRKERLKRRRPRTKSALAVPARRQHAALQTHNRPRVQARPQHPLQSERDVANPVLPLVILILVVLRHIHFKLGLRAKALFVDVVRREPRRAARIRRRRQHELILRKRLLRHNRPRQIQLSPRPVRIPA